MSTIQLPTSVTPATGTSTLPSVIDQWTDRGAATVRSSRVETAGSSTLSGPSYGTDTRSDESMHDTDTAVGVLSHGRTERDTRLERVSTAIAADFDLAIVLLSFVSKQGSVEVGELVQQGDSVAIFRAVFDFYDAGILVREGGAVQLTPMGNRVLERFSAD